MTTKEILQIAESKEAMGILQEIREIQLNMCHKTEYERRSATRKMKHLASMLKEEIK